MNDKKMSDAEIEDLKKILDGFRKSRKGHGDNMSFYTFLPKLLNYIGNDRRMR